MGGGIFINLAGGLKDNPKMPDTLTKVLMYSMLLGAGGLVLISLGRIV